MSSGSSADLPLLAVLADPERSSPEVPQGLVRPTLEGARRHGVLPIVFRKIGGQLPQAEQEEFREKARERVGIMLHLRAIAAELENRIDGDLTATIVKGPDLADHVYPDRADRPFTDLDILATPDAHPALAGMLKDLGYHMHRKRVMDHTEANQEQKWLHPAYSSILVEVHGNLVHYQSLRRQVSFGYSELKTLAAKSLPLARFFTCVTHAMLGHKLHELRLAVDVLQTFRHLDDTEISCIPGLATEMRMKPETALCLRLIAELFGQDKAVEPARAIGEHWWSGLITADTVLSFPDSRWAVMRHHLFRAFQYRVPR